MIVREKSSFLYVDGIMFLLGIIVKLQDIYKFKLDIIVR